MNSWEPKFTDRPDWRDLGWIGIALAVLLAALVGLGLWAVFFA